VRLGGLPFRQLSRALLRGDDGGFLRFGSSPGSFFRLLRLHLLAQRPGFFLAPALRFALSFFLLGVLAFLHLRDGRAVRVLLEVVILRVLVERGDDRVESWVVAEGAAGRDVQPARGAVMITVVIVRG
jgi:hypothetical protein